LTLPPAKFRLEVPAPAVLAKVTALPLGDTAIAPPAVVIEALEPVGAVSVMVSAAAPVLKVTAVPVAVLLLMAALLLKVTDGLLTVNELPPAMVVVVFPPKMRLDPEKLDTSVTLPALPALNVWLPLSDKLTAADEPLLSNIAGAPDPVADIEPVPDTVRPAVEATVRVPEALEVVIVPLLMRLLVFRVKLRLLATTVEASSVIEDEGLKETAPPLRLTVPVPAPLLLLNLIAPDDEVTAIVAPDVDTVAAALSGAVTVS
jgi:hypothetical protein